MNNGLETITYISRRIAGNNGTEWNDDWPTCQGVFVLNGEPGSGKTSFLKALGREFGVAPLDARFALHAVANPVCVFIDAIDELALSNQGDLVKLLVAIQQAGPKLVLLACRSSCWTSQQSSDCKAIFGQEPTLLSLQPFDFGDQKQLYLMMKPDGNFEEFRRNIYRIGLGPLLGNPQLLKLLIGVNEQGEFRTKSEAFELASQKAVQFEANGRDGVTPEKKQEAANEIFAKLLLSNTAAVLTRQTDSDGTFRTEYPRVESLLKNPNLNAREVLETALFRPAGQLNNHEPIHRTVAEHGAASYLVDRLNDPQDPLSLRRLIALIAPNGVVRPDLKGLAGWLGSLGSVDTQLALARIAPYEVLTDGDPALLSRQAANELLRSLIALAEQNPYFRNQEVWRIFSSQLTQLDTGLVQQTLADQTASQQLRELLLEVLVESPQHALQPTLQTITLDDSEDFDFRKFALRALLKIATCQRELLFRQLFALAHQEGVELAARVANSENFPVSREHAYQLLKPTPSWHWSPRHNAHDHIMQVVGKLSADDIAWVMDELITQHSCQCGKASPCWSCDETHSKELGRVLDIYFEVAEPPMPEVIARVAQHMKFFRDIPSHMSASVKRLREDDSLRRAVQEKILSLQIADQTHLFWRVSPHSGIRPQNGDREYIAVWCATNKAWNVWRQLIPVGRSEEVTQVRRFMKGQAKEMPELMAQWQLRKQRDRADRLAYIQRFGRTPNWEKRRAKRQARDRSYNEQDFHQNRAQILAGEDDFWIQKFAQSLLHGDRPEDNVWKVFDDENLPLEALANALPRLISHLPDLQGLAQHAIQSKVINAVYWTHAAVLARLRLGIDLDNLPDSVFYALMTQSEHYSKGVSEEERKALETLVIARLFETASRAEAFIRTYIEPQVEANTEFPPVLWLNRFECFHPFRKSLALEWLTTFPNLRLETVKRLFAMIQAEGALEEIRDLVQAMLDHHFASVEVEDLPVVALDVVSTADIASCENRSTTGENLDVKTFWAVAHLFYSESLDDLPTTYLAGSPENLFRINEVWSRHHRPDLAQWPKLAPDRVDWIVRTFLSFWPAVPLPNGFGPSSAEEERAFRFLDSLVGSLHGFDPDDALPVVEGFLSDEAFTCFRETLLHIKFEANQKLITRNVGLPDWRQVVDFLDHFSIATVEDLRAYVVDQLTEHQASIRGSQFNYWRSFYDGEEHVDENTCSELIAGTFSPIFKQQGVHVDIERMTVKRNRCDITFSKTFAGRTITLFVEVKGQWHKDLLTAASEQLSQKYLIHPDAADQGIYLVIWFGPDEKVAGLKNQKFSSAQQLEQHLSDALPANLKGKVDVFVLDVSQPVFQK